MPALFCSVNMTTVLAEGIQVDYLSHQPRLLTKSLVLVQVHLGQSWCREYVESVKCKQSQRATIQQGMPD